MFSAFCHHSHIRGYIVKTDIYRHQYFFNILFEARELDVTEHRRRVVTAVVYYYTERGHPDSQTGSKYLQQYLSLLFECCK